MAKVGHDAFLKMVKAERDQVRVTRAGGWSWTLPKEEPLTPPCVNRKY